MDSESQVETTSLLSKQTSGIRALPSPHDDDDNYDFDDFDTNLVVENNNSYEIGTQFDDTDNNLVANSSVNGGSDSTISSEFTSNNGSYVNGEEEDFDSETLEKLNEGGGGIGVSQSGFSTGVSSVESPKPVAKLTEEGDDVEEEVFIEEEDKVVGSEVSPRVRVSVEEEDRGSEDEGFQEAKEEPGKEVGGGEVGDKVEEVVSNEESPRVRVSAEEEDEGSEDEGFEEAKEELGGFGGEAKEVGGGDVLDSTNVDDGSVELANEGDAIVDSINVDVGEAVRSGVAVVGVEEEKQESFDSVESKEIEEKAVSEVEEKEEKPSLVEEPSLEDSTSIEGTEVKLTEEGDAVVDSIQIDASEAVRSGTAIVGDVKESKGSEPLSTELENTLTEDSPPKVEVEHADVELQSTGGLETQNDVKEEELPPVGENVKLANEYELLVRESSSEIVDDGYKQNEEALTDTKEINSEVDESMQHESSEIVQTSTLEKGEEFEDGGSDSDGETEFFKGEATSRDFREQLGSGDHTEMIDGQVVTDSEEEEGDSDEEGDGQGRELIDSAALAALLKAATSGGGGGSEPRTITITSQDGSRLFSVERPAGLGTSVRSLRPPSNSTNSGFFAPPNVAAPTEENLSEDDKKKLQKIHDLRVKFLRLVQRLGQTAEQSVASQVLYKLAILAGRTTFPSYSLDNAKQTAAQLEAEGKDDLDFSLNILVLGKTGVGKSATINSIFGEEKVKINAFEPETTSVNLVTGIVDGVKLRVIDAPGLKTSASEQGFNRKILASVKKYTQKFSPDLMLYVDRLDSQTRDLNDLPILRTITTALGTSIWRNAILTLTHAACAPPDGPSGAALGYEVFVGQRSHIIQQSIGQAVGDLRFMNLSMMNPVSLVENHPACRKNREGQKVLPNGQAWRPQLFLLCYSLKILADASLTSKPQDPVDHRKLFGFRVRAPPLPYLLSSLLQSRTHPKLSPDQGGDNADSDIDLDDFSDNDQDDDDEYDQLPPFKPLRKTQIAKLSGEQRKAYFDEYDYRVKLLQKKQWREELKRMKEMKKAGKINLDNPSEMQEDYDGENGAPAAVPVPLPDMVLPPSFDSDSPAYRYRFLEPTSQFLARPVLDTHGWDHDCGYDGVNVEQNLGIAGRYPAAITVQVTKDKKDFNMHMDSAISTKHGENGSSLVGFDIQTIGKQLAYIVRGESKFKTLKKNKTAGGFSVTFLGENVATGVKLEDQISLGKRLVLLGTTGTVRSQKDAAYGANLEVRLKDADYPIGQSQSSFELSLMKWRGDLAIGGNLQSQFSVGRGSKMAVRLALNNKQSGQITVKTSSTDHLALAYVGLVPIVLAVYRKLRPTPSENYTLY